MSQYDFKLIKSQIHIGTHIMTAISLSKCRDLHWRKVYKRSYKNVKVTLFSGFLKFSPRCLYYGFYNHIRKRFLCWHAFLFVLKYFLDPILVLPPPFPLPPPAPLLAPHTPIACSPRAPGKVSHWQSQEKRRVGSHKMFARTCPSGTGWKAQSQQSTKRSKTQGGRLAFQWVSPLDHLSAWAGLPAGSPFSLQSLVVIKKAVHRTGPVTPRCSPWHPPQSVISADPLLGLYLHCRLDLPWEITTKAQPWCSWYTLKFTTINLEIVHLWLT